MAKTLQENLKDRLRDREYRHAYADEVLNTSLASQIRVLRDQRGLSQHDLADKLRTKQSAISRFESADYNRWSLATLRKLAEAFDVRVRISFEPFGTLWQDVANCDKEHLERPAFEEDPEFHSSKAAGNGTRSGSSAGIRTPALLTEHPGSAFVAGPAPDSGAEHSSD